MVIRLEQVDDHRTWALRRSVLRPHQTVDQVAAADLLPGTGPPPASFAALDDRDEVVGTVRVAPAAPPPTVRAGPAPDDPTGWRLRGMAVRADLRNLGVGGDLLDRALTYVAGHGGGLLWCHARVPAVGLYRRAGFSVHGEPWDDPDIGPHVVMARMVTPTGSGSAPG